MSLFAVLKRRAVLGLAVAAGVALAACEPVSISKPASGGGGGGGGGDTVRVALLVSSGTGDPIDDAIARSMENAARLAIADLGASNIELKVYVAGASTSTGSAAATKAANEGADIILGPLYGEASNAAAVAVRSKGINVLSFSNNNTIAGGNLFILGTTFDSIAARLTRYAAGHGKRKIFVVNANSPAEQIGAQAIQRAIAGSSASLAGTSSFELSQNGIVQAVPGIVAKIKASGADAVFFTSTTDGAMPLLADLLPANGVKPSQTQFIGLQRWDVPPTAPALPGLQGGWFAAPDPALAAQFRARYAAAYGSDPHPLASLAYDGIAAIGATAKAGKPMTSAALTQGSGFAGVNGIFRLRGDGTNDRALAVMQIVNGTVRLLEPAPRSFGQAGF